MLYRALEPRRTLQALQHEPFRLWLLERMIAADTWSMRAVARGWLVYSVTGSVLALAWVEAVHAMVGIVVSPLAGVIADRIEKRLIMLCARFCLIFTNLVLALVIFTGTLELWHVVAVTIIEGLLYSLMDPALQSIVPELVSRDVLLSATSMVFMAEGLLSIIGAAACGAIIAAVGVGWVFLGNAPMFALATFVLWKMPRGVVHPRSGTSIRSEMMAGLRYLRASPVLIALVALAFARLVVMQPARSFLAAFASNDLGFDATGLGLLTAAISIGGLCGSLIIVSLRELRGTGAMVLATGSAAAASVLILMVTRTSLSPFIFIILMGGFSNAADVFTRTLMQTSCAPAYRARVASVASIFSFVMVLSVIPAGMLADTHGVPAVVGTLAAIVLAIHVAAAILIPGIRKLS